MPRAPKICSESGCTALVYDHNHRRCDEHHVPWQGKGFDKARADTLAHQRLKSRVLGRVGYRCQLAYEDICIGRATEVDRIDNHAGYNDMNTQAVCVPCHRRKSSMEGHAAKGDRV